MAGISKLTLLMAYLLLFSLSFALWSENINIHIMDVRGRPLPNASISVVYQTYICGKHDLLTLSTNSSGIANAHLVNNVLEEGVYPPCVERQYTIRASYMDATNETIGIVAQQSDYYLYLPVAEYRINVKGANGNELYPINVSYDAMTITSSTSNVALELPLNKVFNINVSYGEISNSTKVTLFKDVSTDFILPVYDLHIKLFNDSGERIKGQIKVDGLSQWSLLTADAIFEKFPYTSANFIIIIGDIEKNIEQEIDSGNISIYLDMTNPVIKDVSQNAVGENVRISATVLDEGIHASGISTNPTLQYLLNDSTEWIITKMYPKSAKIFEGEIPASNQNVVYQIIAEDKQGNNEVYDGRFDFKSSKPSGPGSIPSLSEILSGIMSNLSLPHIIGVVIFIFIIILVYRKIREVV